MKTERVKITMDVIVRVHSEHSKIEVQKIESAILTAIKDYSINHTEFNFYHSREYQF